MPPRRTARAIRQTADLGAAPAPATPARDPRASVSLRTPRVPAVVYLRVSSKEQEKEGFSIPAQQRLLTDYAEARGFEVEREFIDIETAKKAGRAAFDEMIRWLKRHKGTRTIIVEKTDRLYRNIKDWVTLDELGLEIHLVKEGSVLSDESRSHEKFIHGIKVVMAKNYIDNLSEETRKGMAEKAEQGIWPGAAPLGYRNTARADGKRVIDLDPEVAPLVRRLFQTYAQGGISMLELTRQAEGWGLRAPKSGKRLSVPTLHYTLTNLLYTGEFAWNGRVYKGIHPPLVSRDLWERVQERLSDRAVTSARDRKRVFLFTGLLRCGTCADEGEENRLLIGEIQKGRYVYYHCDGCRLKKRAVYVREEKIDALVQRALGSLVIDPSVLAFVRDALRASHEDQRRHHAEALDRLQKQYAALQRRLELAYDDRVDGRISTELFERKSEGWRAEQARIRREMERHERADRAYVDEGLALLELSSRALELYGKQGQDERRRLLNFVLLNCVWRPDNLEVAWRKPFEKFAECARPVAESESASTTAGTGFKGGLSWAAGTLTVCRDLGAQVTA